jgi:hypothetical protein
MALHVPRFIDIEPALRTVSGWDVDTMVFDPSMYPWCWKFNNTVYLGGAFFWLPSDLDAVASTILPAGTLPVDFRPATPQSITMRSNSRFYTGAITDDIWTATVGTDGSIVLNSDGARLPSPIRGSVLSAENASWPSTGTTEPVVDTLPLGPLLETGWTELTTAQLVMYGGPNGAVAMEGELRWDGASGGPPGSRITRSNAVPRNWMPNRSITLRGVGAITGLYGDLVAMCSGSSPANQADGSSESPVYWPVRIEPDISVGTLGGTIFNESAFPRGGLLMPSYGIDFYDSMEDFGAGFTTDSFSTPGTTPQYGDLSGAATSNSQDGPHDGYIEAIAPEAWLYLSSNGGDIYIDPNDQDITLLSGSDPVGGFHHSVTIDAKAGFPWSDAFGANPFMVGGFIAWQIDSAGVQTGYYVGLYNTGLAYSWEVKRVTAADNFPAVGSGPIVTSRTGGAVLSLPVDGPRSTCTLNYWVTHEIGPVTGGVQGIANIQILVSNPPVGSPGNAHVKDEYLAGAIVYGYDPADDGLGGSGSTPPYTGGLILASGRIYGALIKHLDFDFTGIFDSGDIIDLAGVRWPLRYGTTLNPQVI